MRRTIWMQVAAGALTTAALGLAGCASEASGPTGVRKVNADLVAKMDTVGFTCDPPLPADGGSRTPTVAQCHGAEGNIDRNVAVLRVLTSRSARDAAAKDEPALRCGDTGSDQRYLVGNTWFLWARTPSGDQADALLTRLARLLDAKIEVRSCQSPTTDPNGTPTSTTEPDRPGATKGDPLSIGASAELGGYRVRITSVNPDATGLVRGLKPGNPNLLPDKDRFVAVTYDVTNLGGRGSGTDTIVLQVVDASGTSPDLCPAILTPATPLAAGATRSAIGCFDVKATAATSGLVFAHPGGDAKEAENGAYWRLR